MPSERLFSKAGNTVTKIGHLFTLQLLIVYCFLTRTSLNVEPYLLYELYYDFPTRICAYMFLKDSGFYCTESYCAIILNWICGLLSCTYSLFLKDSGFYCTKSYCAIVHNLNCGLLIVIPKGYS